MDVVLIRWPDEATRREEAKAAGLPRLLFVAPGVAAPDVVDVLEDWVRLPAADDDVRARVRSLEARAATRRLPRVDDDGLLRVGDHWVPLSPVESRLADALVEKAGAVVGRDVLARRAWPGQVPTRNALDVHMLRLRRRIRPLGLEIRTVRSRGYVLEPVDGAHALV